MCSPVCWGLGAAHLPPDIFFISLHLLNDCTVDRYHLWKLLTTQKNMEKRLYEESFSSLQGCLCYIKCVFYFLYVFSLWLDSDDWQSLTDVFCFFSLFLHKTYFCIFTLRNLLLSLMQFCYSWVYIYTDIHIFLYPPLPSISSVLMFRNPRLRSIIDYIMWTAISFLHLCMNWDFVKMLSQSLCVKYMYKLN